MPRRPNIGVTPDLVEAPRPHYELGVPYAEAVFRGGGLPFALAYTDDPALIEAYLDRISGLLVTGGDFDVSPELYGAEADGSRTLKPARTAFEEALVKGALRRQMPLLAVCGGMQLLNVALGGSLIQDLAKERPEAFPHEQAHPADQPQHPVEVAEGTELAAHLGAGQLMVNSTHHQAIDRLGSGLTVSARSADEVIEAIELPGHFFAIGVQWHPERLLQSVPAHLGLYRALAQKARESRQ